MFCDREETNDNIMNTVEEVMSLQGQGNFKREVTAVGCIVASCVCCALSVLCPPSLDDGPVFITYLLCWSVISLLEF